MAELQEHLKTLLAGRGRSFLERRHATPDQVLSALQLEPGPEVVSFVYCDLRSCADLLAPSAIPERFQVLNPRISTLPFYVFRRGGAATLHEVGDTLTIGYALAHPDRGLREGDIEILVARQYDVTRTRTAELVTERETDPSLLADGLIGGRYDVVAIYDHEPSLFLNRFLRAIERSPVRGDAHLWPTVGSAEQYAPLPLSGLPGTPTYLVLPLGEQRFYQDPYFEVVPDDSTIVAIARTDTADLAQFLPVLLTDARTRWPEPRLDTLSRALGDFYVMVSAPLLDRAAIEAERPSGSLMPSSPEAREVGRTFLVNGYLNNRDNPYLLLSLYAFYSTQGNRIADNTADYLWRMLNRQIDQEVASPENLPAAARLLAFLGLSEVDSDSRKRYRLSPCGYTKEFEEAEQLFQRAREARGDRRAGLLLGAREALSRAILLHAEPGRRQQCTGMWRAYYDPYLLLTLIDVHLRWDGEVFR